MNNKLISNKEPKYALRKLSIGVASVLLGTTCYLGISTTAHADILTTHEVTSATTTESVNIATSNASSNITSQNQGSNNNSQKPVAANVLANSDSQEQTGNVANSQNPATIEKSTLVLDQNGKLVYQGSLTYQRGVKQGVQSSPYTGVTDSDYEAFLPDLSVHSANTKIDFATIDHDRGSYSNLWDARAMGKQTVGLDTTFDQLQNNPYLQFVVPIKSDFSFINKNIELVDQDGRPVFVLPHATFIPYSEHGDDTSAFTIGTYDANGNSGAAMWFPNSFANRQPLPNNYSDRHIIFNADHSAFKLVFSPDELKQPGDLTITLNLETQHKAFTKNVHILDQDGNTVAELKNQRFVYSDVTRRYTGGLLPTRSNDTFNYHGAQFGRQTDPHLLVAGGAGTYELTASPDELRQPGDLTITLNLSFIFDGLPMIHDAHRIPDRYGQIKDALINEADFESRMSIYHNFDATIRTNGGNSWTSTDWELFHDLGEGLTGLPKTDGIAQLHIIVNQLSSLNDLIQTYNAKEFSQVEGSTTLTDAVNKLLTSNDEINHQLQPFNGYVIGSDAVEQFTSATNKANLLNKLSTIQLNHDDSLQAYAYRIETAYSEKEGRYLRSIKLVPVDSVRDLFDKINHLELKPGVARENHWASGMTVDEDDNVIHQQSEKEGGYESIDVPGNAYTFDLVYLPKNEDANKISNTLFSYYTYIDTDTHKQVGKPVVISGLQDSTLQLNYQVPEGYQVIRDTAPKFYQFTKDSKPFTVLLKQEQPNNSSSNSASSAPADQPTTPSSSADSSSAQPATSDTPVVPSNPVSNTNVPTPTQPNEPMVTPDKPTTSSTPTSDAETPTSSEVQTSDNSVSSAPTSQNTQSSEVTSDSVAVPATEESDKVASAKSAVADTQMANAIQSVQHSLVVATNKSEHTLPQTGDHSSVKLLGLLTMALSAVMTIFNLKDRKHS